MLAYTGTFLIQLMLQETKLESIGKKQVMFDKSNNMLKGCAILNNKTALFSNNNKKIHLL